jgi:hypothetical protein
MIFLCFGMQKSASSFAWSLVKDFAQKLGFNQWLLRQKYIEDSDRRVEYQNIRNIEQFDYFNERIPEREILVIKSHWPITPELAEHIHLKGGSAIATYRDPLDIAISLLDVGKSERLKPLNKQRHVFSSILSIEDAAKRLPEAVEIANSWLANDFIEHITYENLCYETPDVIEKIVTIFNHTGHNISLESKSDIQKNYSNAEAAGIPEFNIGGVGRYKDKMTSEQIVLLKEKYSDFRQRLKFVDNDT